MEKPEGYGGETLPGASEKGRGGTDQAWEEAWGQKALALGLLEQVPGRAQGSWRGRPGLKRRLPERWTAEAVL